MGNKKNLKQLLKSDLITMILYYQDENKRLRVEINKKLEINKKKFQEKL